MKISSITDGMVNEGFTPDVEPPPQYNGVKAEVQVSLGMFAWFTVCSIGMRYLNESSTFIIPSEPFGFFVFNTNLTFVYKIGIEGFKKFQQKINLPPVGLIKFRVAQVR